MSGDDESWKEIKKSSLINELQKPESPPEPPDQGDAEKAPDEDK